MIRRCWFFFFCFFSAGTALSWAQPALAQQENLLPNWLEVSGWLDTVHSARMTSPHDRVTSRARLRLEARADFDWLYGFYSVDGEKNWIIAEETGVDTQEFWLEHVADSWDVRMGRQIIIWGQADGVQITDIISPPDLTESLTRDLDEIRMPVDAARLRILGDTITSELIVIPVFKAAVYPQGDDNPWAIGRDMAGSGVRVLPTEKPDTSLENTEIAVRVSGYFSGLDVAASVFYTWDDTPALHPVIGGENDTTSLLIQPKHHRLTIFGLGFSLPWSDFVFRGESAFYRGQYLACVSPVYDPLAKNSIKWLAGADWTPGDNWTITAQLVGQSVLDYESSLAAEENSFLATLNVSKKLMNERLTIANMLYLDCDNSGIYDRIKADYEVSDGLHLLVGMDIFRGSEGQFNLYEDNSQVWMKAKYNF